MFAEPHVEELMEQIEALTLEEKEHVAHRVSLMVRDARIAKMREWERGFLGKQEVVDGKSET